MGEQSGDKSEEPTPHRLKEAREKGQVVKSKEVTTAFLLILSYVVLRFIGGFAWEELSNMVRAIYSLIPNIQDFGYGFVAAALMIALRAFALILTPLLGAVFLAAVLVEALQTQGVSSIDPLSPKLERINPIEGFKRMFSMQGIFELIKSLLKIIIVFWITWTAISRELPFVIGLINAHPWEALAVGGSIAFNVALRVSIFYLFIAVLDYLYKRFEFMKNLRMTKQEIKEEYKRLEGDPHVKQKMRDLQRAMSNNRMMSSVPQADVVVTNPTHLAVAISYQAPKMKAPKLLAKGRFEIAEQIKAIAEKNNIPIVENEELARAIYRSAKIGEEMPNELYQAVAEVLAFVYKLKKDRVRRRKEWLGPLKGIRDDLQPAIRS
ncbi:MAG: flagellar biosynthesis protein FlhB [Candidatus Margulisiibacteriota bacterium]